MKTFSESIWDEAEALLTASRSLDYQGIASNDYEAVVKLKSVLEQLSINGSYASDELNNYAAKQGEKENIISDVVNDCVNDVANEDILAQANRRELMTATIAAEGLDARIGKVYNSFASTREVDFDHVPHKNGLPPFDLVFAADYSPLAGLHGIFIDETQVMSIVLASDAGKDAKWEILKSRAYSSQEELMEYVTLLSAGFELP